MVRPDPIMGHALWGNAVSGFRSGGIACYVFMTKEDPIDVE